MPVFAKCQIAFSLAILVAALATPAEAQQPSLPGGANTLNETHGAWTVTCAIGPHADGEQARRCALSQTQMHSQKRQRVLAIELRPGEDGLTGALMLPFGLALAPGVSYQLDEGKSGAAQPFRTCLPAGCLIDVAFDARTVEGLKSGGALKIRATADGGQETAFSISLDGFASAFDRVVALMQ